MLFEQKEINCFDIKCFVILINRIFLIKTNFNLFIKTITNLIIIYDFKFNKYKISKYIIFSLYFSNEEIIIMLTSRKIHIINNFKTNILININIIMLKQIDILAFQLKVKIDNCNIIVFIEIYIKNRVIIYSIHVKKSIIIFSHI